MADMFQRAVRFAAPEWPADNAVRWSGLAQQASGVGQGMGASGARFADLVAHIRSLLAQGAFDAVADRLGERRVLRALLTVWAADDLAWMSMPTLFPAARTQLLERPSRLTCTVLAALFWKVFDRLEAAGQGLFAAVGGTLYEVAQQVVADDGDTAGPLSAIARSPGHWLTAQSPATLAADLVTAGLSMDDHLRAVGVAGMEGRFGILARREYYLAEIARADHSLDGHPFLTDVTREAVKAAETENDLSFGHALLTALCDKPMAVDPSTQWLEAITGIGGDPRLREKEHWRRWWSAIRPDLTERAARWMVGADLQVYFDALDDYATHHGTDSMRRMLPARTTFLRGLYRSGLVREVRLILGDEVRRGIMRRSRGVSIDAARYIGANAAETAVVVLTCEGFTVVEGSHNFQIYLYAGDPLPMLTDPRRRVYSLTDFKDTVPERHRGIHGEGRQTRYRHNEIWQPKALEFLRGIGVTVDPRAVYSAGDFEKQRRRELYGATTYTTTHRRTGWN
ncbi:EH signature domain-containing protein [Promicromonospora aerolata]|uniref:EH signature domain-containing protein n=1 Tax=Promicromonospora aerolata TaxID=195749 RepID=A0ABW4V5D8_9MICO